MLETGIFLGLCSGMLQVSFWLGVLKFGVKGMGVLYFLGQQAPLAGMETSLLGRSDCQHSRTDLKLCRTPPNLQISHSSKDGNFFFQRFYTFLALGLEWGHRFAKKTWSALIQKS